MACFLNLPAPIYKRKDVISKRKTKTYLPPPQPGSLENNPMLLLILNSFVSKTTHWRPYLWVRVFVHLRKNTCISVRKNEGRWLPFFSFFGSLLALYHLIYFPVASHHYSLPASRCTEFIQMGQPGGGWHLWKSDSSVQFC